MAAQSASEMIVADVLDVLAAAEAGLERLGAVLYQIGSNELGPVLAQVRRVAAMADAASVATVAEGIDRGVANASGEPSGPPAPASARDWVGAHCPRTDPATLTRLLTLGHAAQLPRRQSLTRAVLNSDIGLVTAVVALAEFARLEPDLNDLVKDDVLEAYVEVGRRNDPRSVRQVRPEVIARFGGERQLEKTIDRLREQRHLSGPVELDRLTHYTLRLDPEGAARLEAGLDLLAAPTPTATERDLRTAGQRRADALLTLVARAVTAGGACHAQPKAQLIITIPMAEIRQPTHGCGRSIGRTTQALLDPEAVRKIGCDADIMLLALGAKTEPLALGRSKRLVTPGMLKALWVRDSGCTYPGCHAPPAWSDAHHIRHWSDGGPTNLNNLALLCQRHHTKVHQLGASAHVTHGAVHWRL